MSDNNKAASLRDLGTRTDFYMIDPRRLEIETGFNPRDYSLKENRDHLDELKANIKQHGVQSPVLVRFDKASGHAYVVDGECRLRASLELIAEGVAIDAIPAKQVPGGNEVERLLIALTANTGKPLSIWEDGLAYKRLINFGWNTEKIANNLGRTLRYVNKAVELSDAPEEIRKLLSEGAITPSLAQHEMRTKEAPEAIASLKARAGEAKANGKIARKTLDKPKFNASQILGNIQKLVESCEDEIFNPENRWVEVDRLTMVKLAKLVGIEEKVKA